jgi:hypothetical protein
VLLLFSEVLYHLEIRILTKANGDTEVIEMRGKRSGNIYKEIVEALRAQPLKELLASAKETADVMANSHLRETKPTIP